MEKIWFKTISKLNFTFQKKIIGFLNDCQKMLLKIAINNDFNFLWFEESDMKFNH